MVLLLVDTEQTMDETDDDDDDDDDDNDDDHDNDHDHDDAWTFTPVSGQTLVAVV